MPRAPLYPGPLAASCRWITALLIAAGASLPQSTLRAEEGRFDAQVFRPSAAPRDLVMVRKSEVIGHLSPTVGVFSDLGFDPLVLVDKSTDQAVGAVLARLTLTPMAGFGLFDWGDVTVAVPLVAWQTGHNLRSIGTEGPVRSFTLGDIRLSTRMALPYLNRRDDVRKGFGMAISGDLNLPTGVVAELDHSLVVRPPRSIGRAKSGLYERGAGTGGDGSGNR